MSGLLSCLVLILHMLILLSCNKSFRLIFIPAINKFCKGLFSLSFVKRKPSPFGEIIMFNDKGNSCTCCERLTSYICLFFAILENKILKKNPYLSI